MECSGKLSDLFLDSSVPKEFLPEFRYYKIAINEITKRDILRVRNAVSAVFILRIIIHQKSTKTGMSWFIF